MEADHDAAVKDRMRYAFRLATARETKGREMKVLLGLYNKQMLRFRRDPEAAKKLLTVGESKRIERFVPSELAAWTAVASVILNLDETITKS